MASDRHIDDAIDRAVRDIMRAEPRAGLRGRVLTEIERRSGNALFRPAFAGAALLAVAAVLVAVLLRPVTPTTPESTAARQDPGAPAPVPAAPPEATTPRPATPTASDSAEGAPRPVPRPRQPEGVAFPAQGMVAAASVSVDAAPVTLVSLPDSAIGTADAKTLEAPIVVSPIDIAPISVPAIVISPMSRSR